MAESNFSLQKTLTMLLDEKKYHSLRDILSTMNPADIAAIFDDLDQARLPLLFRLLPKELAAETFVEMEPEAQELLIQGFSDSELKEVIDELYVDDAVDIAEEMPANVVQRILTQAEPDMRKQINEILRYPEDSAGSIMTTEYVALRPNMTVEEAMTVAVIDGSSARFHKFGVGMLTHGLFGQFRPHDELNVKGAPPQYDPDCGKQNCCNLKTQGLPVPLLDGLSGVFCSGRSALVGMKPTGR